MTKKELRWRLSELPTGGEVADLVSEGVITKEEARGILFNEGEVKSSSTKALEKQIEFLEGLVKELSQHRTTVGYPVYIEKYIDRWLPYRGPMWTMTGATTTVTAGGNTGTLVNYTQNLLGQTTSSNTIS